VPEGLVPLQAVMEIHWLPFAPVKEAGFEERPGEHYGAPISKTLAFSALRSFQHPQMAAQERATA